MLNIKPSHFVIFSSNEIKLNTLYLSLLASVAPLRKRGFGAFDFIKIFKEIKRKLK